MAQESSMVRYFHANYRQYILLRLRALVLATNCLTFTRAMILPNWITPIGYPIGIAACKCIFVAKHHLVLNRRHLVLNILCHPLLGRDFPVETSCEPQCSIHRIHLQFRWNRVFVKLHYLLYLKAFHIETLMVDFQFSFLVKYTFLFSLLRPLFILILNKSKWIASRLHDPKSRMTVEATVTRD